MKQQPPSWTLCNIGYPSGTKSHEILFAHNLFMSDTAMLCAKFQDYWITEIDVMDKWYFMRFEFKMGFGLISYIAQTPGYLGIWI